MEKRKVGWSGKTLSVTTGRFGLDVPGEAGAAPSRGRRGVDWQGAARRLQLAAQQPHSCCTASRSQKGALQRGGNQPAGPAPLKSRERHPTSFLCFSLLFPPPLPFPLLLPPPGSECPCAPRTGVAVRAAFLAPSPLPHSPSPPPRRARRSRREGRWRRPPAPAVPRGRSEEPEKPTEASREDAAAEDEPAERAVSPAGRSPEG